MGRGNKSKPSPDDNPACQPRYEYILARVRGTLHDVWVADWDRCVRREVAAVVPSDVDQPGMSKKEVRGAGYTIVRYPPSRPYLYQPDPDCWPYWHCRC